MEFYRAKVQKGLFEMLSVRSQNDELPWVEKYRPSNLEDLVAHEDIVSTIQKFIDENRLPHLLLFGPAGVGKSSLILACARRLYGNAFKSMTLELNASDDRGIDVVREQIKTFASTKTIFNGGFKLIILDEADAMTNAAQAALRRIIEKYTANVRFCLICNYVSKLIPAIQSRCTKFRFAPLSQSQMLPRLNVICSKESYFINITDDGKQSILRLAQGDMRKVMNILQSTHAAFGLVNETNVCLSTGTPIPSDVASLVQLLLKDDFVTTCVTMNKLRMDRGLALQDIIRDIHRYLNDYDMPRLMRIYLIDQMAEIEYNLSSGCTESIQLAALVGVFRAGRSLLA